MHNALEWSIAHAAAEDGLVQELAGAGSDVSGETRSIDRGVEHGAISHDVVRVIEGVPQLGTKLQPHFFLARNFQIPEKAKIPDVDPG